MFHPLFVEERRRVILEELKQRGRVSVNALSHALHVSTVTIRQDLRALEEDGLLERTYGGAVLRKPEPYLPELSFDVRQDKQRKAKEAIGVFAATLVKDGYGIVLDASTTAFALVPHLRRLERVTVVTNSLIIAQSFLDAPAIQVLMPGGRLRRDAVSLVGNPSGLPDINLNIGFFGTQGITFANGMTDTDPDEVTIKKAMMARCISTVVVADGSKWDQIAPYTFATPDQIHRIVTANVPLHLATPFREQGIEVDILNVP
jgi:DeoR/GlpR family transcriptional regulator of sugar metabolism